MDFKTHSSLTEPPSNGAMLAQLIVSAPRISAIEASRGKVDAWLADIAGHAQGRELAALLKGASKVNELIVGLAEHSPYLWDLISAEPERLLRLLRSDPERHFVDLLAGTVRAVDAAMSEDEVMRLLRRTKAEAALLIALADIGGVWPVAKVTHVLTELADVAVSCAVRFLLGEAVRSGKLDPPDPAAPERGSGYIVLAMGKMGAFELNYSSDIDLIVFFDPRAPSLRSGVEGGVFFVRVTRGLVKLLQARTADGYVFRVDLRLRPDPASTHIAISTPAALDYYESRGQNWERSALIKARPCAGDIAAGEALLKDLLPFVWRKYMDFAALADIHAMKRQTHAYKGHGEIAVEGHNVKIGRGGIREIELFVQIQQLIAGGRHPVLRTRSTLATLKVLAEGGWISAGACRELEDAYCFLRKVEHRLQMVADEQTQMLPADQEGLECFSRFLGFGTREAFSEILLPHLRKVQGHYSLLFENAPASGAPQRVFNFPKDADDRETLDGLAAMGLRNPLVVSALIRGWLAGHYPSLRSEFARGQLADLLPVLLDQLSRAGNQDSVLPAFDRFLGGLHSGSSGGLFSLLRQNPDLLALIVLILGTAPRLADTLAHQPQVLDALIDPTFFGTLPDAAKLAAELSRSLAQAESFEDLLDRLRIFGQEHMFLIGARILSGTVAAEQAGGAFASLAEVIIAALHRAIEERFAAAHGHVAGQKTALLALGKLGGREMTATSDLDLILVYDFDEAHPDSDGARPLYGGQYFARLTQRLINALTAQTNYGALYHVDMRLRPSGRSGPVATQIDAFRSYQANEAWTWEHMALTRARVVSATQGFAETVEAAIHEVLCRNRNAEVIAADAIEMRRAIATEKGEDDIWDLKYAAGGLIDVEFIAQYLQLVHAADHPEILDASTGRALEKAARLGLLTAEDADVLRLASRLYHDLSQIMRLCFPGKFAPKDASLELQALLARAADVPDFTTLEAHLGEIQARVRRSFENILGGSL